MASTTLAVSGMTCGHCVATVTSALEALDHVDHVEVELDSGGQSLVTVGHGADVSLAELAGAISESGYTLEAVTARS